MKNSKRCQEIKTGTKYLSTPKKNEKTEGNQKPMRDGLSTKTVTCLACNKKTEAVIWSLAGTGKRCPHCNSLILSDGTQIDSKSKLDKVNADRLKRAKLI